MTNAYLINKSFQEVREIIWMEMSVSENTVRVPEQVEKAGGLENVGKDEELGDTLEKTIEETAAALRRPDVVAALQKRLHAEMLDALPVSVKRRIKSLKKIQLEVTHLEAKFYEEVHMLEMKYHDMYTPLYEKRGEIILGKYEPTDEECQWTLDDEKDEEGEGEKKKPEEEQPAEPAAEGDSIKIDDVKGVPDFWLTIFKNVQMLSEMVQDHDEPVLKHLQDIKVQFRQADPMGFTLEFHFSPNDYFTNSVLTKEYEMKCIPDDQDPFSFEGPEIFKCKGCTIEWKEGKNVTQKVFNKKEQHSGEAVTTVKTVQNDSFFNFFSPPNIPDDNDADVDEEVQTLLISDFEIGHYIRERLIPRAVLYFTGEALEDEEYEEEEEEDDDEDDEDDDDGEEEEEEDDEAAVPQETIRQPCRPC